MFDTILRDETPEEMEKRKAIEVEKAAKDKKKPTKNDESKTDLVPQKIRDVELTDIETHNYMLN
jgi:hypothetical protein